MEASDGSEETDTRRREGEGHGACAAAGETGTVSFGQLLSLAFRRARERV